MTIGVILLPFRVGGAVKSIEEVDDLINQLTNDKGVFRAAPGFAQDCSRY